MLSQEKRQEKFQLCFEPETYRRIIGKKEVIIHCHHYNARLQSVIESAKQINGKEIILSAAEEVFSEYVTNFYDNEQTLKQKWQVAAELFAHLGYGTLDFSQIDRGTITSSNSHFVEGWKAGFREIKRPVCTFTEGYLQGVIHGITGESVYVHEDACMMAGANKCEFSIRRNRSHPVKHSVKKTLSFTPKQKNIFSTSNIDEQKIINALVEMSFVGNREGLIPAFNVYLANTPADFYNLICLRFVQQMKEQKLLRTAKTLLMYAGEICAVNTLRGIITSPEWDALIAPMVQEESDKLYGLIAVTNALGWGNWHVTKYELGEILELESFNGYEALGYLEYIGKSQEPQCFMLPGVAAGIMALLHGEGKASERVGTYVADENSCIACQHESCKIHVALP